MFKALVSRRPCIQYNRAALIRLGAISLARAFVLNLETVSPDICIELVALCH